MHELYIGIHDNPLVVAKVWNYMQVPKDGLFCMEYIRNLFGGLDPLVQSCRDIPVLGKSMLVKIQNS